MHLLEAHVSSHHYKSTLAHHHSVPVIPNPPAASTTDTTGHQSVSSSGLWSHTVNSSPPAARQTINSQSTSAVVTTHSWTGPSLLCLNPDLQSKSVNSRPQSASPSSISQSQPTLCLQPPNDSDELSCLLSTGESTQSLRVQSLSSYPLLCPPSETQILLQASNPDPLIPTTTSHNLNPDISIFPVAASPPMFPRSPPRSSLDLGSLGSDAQEHPLGAHDSLESLLGNGGSTESRDSGSASSFQSSVGVQTQSTEQSWCLDLTD